MPNIIKLDELVDNNNIENINGKFENLFIKKKIVINDLNKNGEINLNYNLNNEPFLKIESENNFLNLDSNKIIVNDGEFKNIKLENEDLKSTIELLNNRIIILEKELNKIKDGNFLQKIVDLDNNISVKINNLDVKIDDLDNNISVKINNLDNKINNINKNVALKIEDTNIKLNYLGSEIENIVNSQKVLSIKIDENPDDNLYLIDIEDAKLGIFSKFTLSDNKKYLYICYQIDKNISYWKLINNMIF